MQRYTSLHVVSVYQECSPVMYSYWPLTLRYTSVVTGLTYVWMRPPSIFAGGPSWLQMTSHCPSWGLSA